jgi:hypothetical protein
MTNKKKEVNNLDLWESVERTNPKNTKRVKQRGGFTAIDAYSQIREATRVFGPMGIGFGYDVKIHRSSDLVEAEMDFWYKLNGVESKPIHVFGSVAAGFSGKPDVDASKKAVTDALTKALSYLGFNADVFLGRFDDNKYVNEMSREFSDDEAELKQPSENGITGKQRGMIWALACKIWDSNKAKDMLYDLAKQIGLPDSSHDYTKQQASSLIKKLEKITEQQEVSSEQ